MKNQTEIINLLFKYSEELGKETNYTQLLRLSEKLYYYQTKETDWNNIPLLLYNFLLTL